MRIRILIASTISAGCTGAPALSVVAPVHATLPQAFGPPAAVDPRAHGASYLALVGKHIQPNWSHFLEDCRVRLPSSHPLNVLSLAATVHLVIDRAGNVSVVHVATSGSADFDLAVRDVLADASRVEAPPIDVLSDDDHVHMKWLFARDSRQAGPATASLFTIEDPVLVVTNRLVNQGELSRAARRVAMAGSSEPDRLLAAQRVMIATLREALGSIGASSRKLAVEAIGRAPVPELAPQVRSMISPPAAPELRLAAITAVAQLGDQASVGVIAGMLPGDLQSYPRLAQAETAALVALGEGDRASVVIRHALDSDAAVTALHAHALAPDLMLAPRLAAWFSRGDARTRAAVCAAVPASWGPQIVVLRGLRDPDATVRAACAETAARQGHGGPSRDASARVGAPQLARLRDLVSDRDRVVRARAVAALAILEPSRISRASTDPAPEVRAAAVGVATEPELRTLAADPDPDVRAAAIVVLGDRGQALLVHAASDVSPEVRRAAIGALTDEVVLARLATDDSPEVATAALVALTARRGRSAMATPLLIQLAGAPAGSAERVRIALAFLLGR